MAGAGVDDVLGGPADVLASLLTLDDAHSWPGSKMSATMFRRN